MTGDAHEKAIEAAIATYNVRMSSSSSQRIATAHVEKVVAAYLASLAEQGDPLVPASSLVEIARVSVPELNPDGADQAAATMRLIAVEALTAAGVPLPVQRQSVAAGGQFPIKLDDGYPCSGIRPDGRRVHFGDLLSVGDRVGDPVSGDEANAFPPFGVVVRKDDGLWIVAEVQRVSVAASDPLVRVSEVADR